MMTWGARADARREKYADELEIRRVTVRSAEDKKAQDGADLALIRAKDLLRAPGELVALVALRGQEGCLGGDP